MLTFAPELPSHVMEILKPYFTFVQVNTKLILLLKLLDIAIFKFYIFFLFLESKH